MGPRRRPRRPPWALVVAGFLLLSAPSAQAQAPPTKDDVTIVDRSVFTREREVRQLIEAAEALLSSPYGRTAADFSRARTLLEDAVTVDPDRAETYYLVAQAYLRYFGEQETAAQLLEQFLDLAPPAHRDRADVHELLGQMAAIALRDAGDGPAAVMLADRAERHLLAAYDLLVTERRSWAMASVESMLSDVAVRHRDLEASLRYLRAALDHGHPEWFELTLRSAYILVALQRPEEAEGVLAELAGSARAQVGLIEHEALLYAQAHVQRALGNHQTALQYLEVLERSLQDLQLQLSLSGSQLSPALARLYDEMATTFFELKDLEQAERYYRRAYEIEPSDPIHMNNLAWILVVRSEQGADALDEALTLAEQAVALDPKTSYLDTLAEVYARLGRNNDALATIDEALEQNPDWAYLQQQRRRFAGQQVGFPAVTGEFSQRRRWAPPEDPSSF